MPATINYNRPALALVNVTGMDMTLLYGEKPDAPATVAGTGTTAAADLRIQADADGGGAGGPAIQDLFKVDVTPSITTDGKATCTVVVTPVGGAGADLTPQTLAVEHGETVDAWQAAAGFPRV